MTGPGKSSPELQVHGTALEVEGVGLLLRGPSGSGKSDLALRLIEGGAKLIADDRVDLTRREDQLSARAPQALAGLLEVREIGILQFPFLKETVLKAIIDLYPSSPENRLPEERVEDVAGLQIRLFRIDPWQISAPVKVRLVSQLLSGSITRIDDGHR